MKAETLFEGRREPTYVRTGENEGGAEVGISKLQYFARKCHI